MNNTGILKKCIDELNSATPRLDYLRGMLETLVEMQDVSAPMSLREVTHPPYSKAHSGLGSVGESLNPPVAQDEAAIMEAQARAAIDTVKALSEKSTQ